MPQAAIPYLMGASLAVTAGSIVESRKARKQRSKAARVESRRRDIESRRATVANIEDARQAVGSIQNVAALTGGGQSSGALGAVSSLTTQLGANVTFNQQLLTFAKRQESYLQSAMDRDFKSQTFSSLASLSMTVAGMVKK